MNPVGKIDLGESKDESRGYDHLVPLVEDLVRRGNRLERTDRRGGPFVSNQGGPVAFLAQPLDFAYLREAYDVSPFHLDEEHDALSDPRYFVIVYGSGGRLAAGARPGRRRGLRRLWAAVVGVVVPSSSRT